MKNLKGRGNLFLLLLLAFLSVSPEISLAGINEELMEAIRHVNIEAVQDLRARGADINARGPAGVTALMLAADKGQTGTVQLLLEKGADFNARNMFGQTTLVMASQQGRSEVVKLLTQKGGQAGYEGGRLHGPGEGLGR